MKKRKFQYLSAVLLLALMVGGLAGCGGSSSGDDDNNNDTNDNDNDTDTTSELTGWENLGTLGEIDNGGYTAHAMVIDSSGNPVVARQDQDNKLHVHRWDSGSETWEVLGDAIGGFRPALAVDSSGNPLLVYWAQPAGEDYSTAYAVRWDGADWNRLGDTDDALVDRSNAYSSGQFADVEFDSHGDPVVALPRVNQQRDEIIVRRWNGTSWENVGNTTQVDTDKGTRWGSLATGADGRLVLAWAEMPQDVNGFTTEVSGSSGYVAEFDSDAATWSQLGQGSATPGEVAEPDNENARQRAMRVTLDTNGIPVVAWEYHAIWEVGTATYLRRWEDPDWTDAAGRLDDTYSPALALDASNQPLVAADDNTIDREVTLNRWESSIWRTLGDPLPGEGVSLAITDGGMIYVGVQDYGSPYELSIYRYSP